MYVILCIATWTTSKQQQSKERNSKAAVPSNTEDSVVELPSELDYFKYASKPPLKRKASSRHRNTGGNSDDDDDSDAQAENADPGSRGEGPSQPRHRVTCKGSDVPAPVDAFSLLQKRYDIPPRIMTNLEASGYRYPTAIQSYGCPVNERDVYEPSL